MQERYSNEIKSLNKKCEDMNRMYQDQKKRDSENLEAMRALANRPTVIERRDCEIFLSKLSLSYYSKSY